MKPCVQVAVFITFWRCSAMTGPHMKTVKERKLPKFDSTPWLVFGITFSFLLSGLNFWSLIGQRHDPFFPYQLVKLLGIMLGLILGIHCIDMIGYYRKNGRLK
jgi:hypothetical protein